MAVLCVDIGGSKLLAGVMDEAGRVLCRSGRPFAAPDAGQVVAAIVEESRAVLAEYAQNPQAGPVACAGVAIPGLADPEAGLWVYAPFSKIENLDIRGLFQRELGLPAYLENDGNICCFGERRFGVARNTEDFLWLTVSNGIGGGLFLGGRLYCGPGGSAGELGHLRVEPGGRACPCGGWGCLEALAAGPGISASYAEENPGGEWLSAREIAQRARAGDETARRVYTQEGDWLARGIAAAVNLMNLPLVVLGGGVGAGAFDVFAPALQEALPRYLFAAGNPGLRIEKTALGYEAALISAGAYALCQHVNRC